MLNLTAGGLGDRVWETATPSGTGDVTLQGAAASNYQTFSAALQDGQLFPYVIAEQGGANWETGLGAYHAATNTFSRTQVFTGSGGAGQLVNFAGITADVRLDFPVELITQGYLWQLICPADTVGGPLAVIWQALHRLNQMPG